MSIAQRNEIEGLKRRVEVLEQKLSEPTPEQQAVADHIASKTLTLPEKRKPNG